VAPVSDTRQRILDTARELFNERGLHRVGVRDIARAAGISPGNLGYHFATKDDLVAALIIELHQLNARTVFADMPTSFSMLTLYRSAIWAMRNILLYRFCQVSYVDAVARSDELSKLEAALWVKRRGRNHQLIELLAQAGYIDARKFAIRAEYLHEQGQMISSGWLAAAEVRGGWRDDREIVLHYAKVGVVLLEPYATSKGVRQLRKILAGEHDRDTWTAVTDAIAALESQRDPSARPPGDARDDGASPTQRSSPARPYRARSRIDRRAPPGRR
jgi:AcrR family transcriptional regulator